MSTPSKSKTKSTKAQPSIPAQVPTAKPAFTTDDPALAYQHFEADAKAVPSGSLVKLNAKPERVLVAARTAQASFSKLAAKIAVASPTAPLAFFSEIYVLALAFYFAASQVVKTASKGEIAARLAKLSALRSPMLKQLEVFADPALGLADADKVRAIRAGNGPLDKVKDAISIAAYFTELGSAIAGKHPFTAAQTSDLASEAQWLLGQLTPSKTAADKTLDPHALARDQVWTLLNNRYDALRSAMANVVGIDNVNQYCPPLGSYLHTKKTAATVATTNPARAATPGTVAQPSAAPAAPAPAQK